MNCKGLIVSIIGINLLAHSFNAMTTDSCQLIESDNQEVIYKATADPFTQEIDAIKRIVFKPTITPQFVYILYSINGTPQTAYVMTKDCTVWYYLIPQVKTGDQINYLFAYENNGSVVYTQEYSATI